MAFNGGIVKKWEDFCEWRLNLEHIVKLCIMIVNRNGTVRKTRHRMSGMLKCSISRFVSCYFSGKHSTLFR